MQQFANYISTTLAATISAIQTAIQVTSVAGMPAVTTANGDYFYLTLVDAASAAAQTNPPAQREVVKVTNITGTTLTVVRGQDNTSAQIFLIGAVAEIRFNAQAGRDLTSLYSNVLAPCNVYQESGETAQFAYDQFRLSDPGPHTTSVRAAVHIEYRPVGSGLNGPTADDVAFQVSNIKHNYPSSGVQGQTDGLNVVVRNDLGDAATLVGNTQVADGFGCLFEGATTQVPPGGGAVTKFVDVQCGTIDTPTGNVFGFVADMNIGAGTDAYRAQTSGTGTFTNFFNGVASGVEKIAIDPNGAYSINAVKRLDHQGGVNVWTSLYDGSGTEDLRLGGTADPANYYGNTTHAWYTRGFVTKVAQLNNTGSSLYTANGGVWTQGHISELITLNTAGLTTDSVADLLPANSIIEAIVYRITTTITTTTDFALGDPTTSSRFTSPSAVLAAGTTGTGLNHWSGAITTLAAGPSQAAAAKLRITCTGANPGAGVMRVTVFYRTFTPPTS